MHAVKLLFLNIRKIMLYKYRKVTTWNKDQNYTCERDEWISLFYPINDNSTILIIIIICCCCRAFGGSGNLRIPHWGGVYGCLLEYLPLIQELFEAKVSGLVMNDIAFFSLLDYAILVALKVCRIF